MKPLNEIDGVIRIGKTAEKPFERVRIRYKTEAAVRAIVQYVGGEDDIIFLEKGKNEFRWFVPGYVDGKTQTGIESLSYVSLEDNNAELEIEKVSFETVKKPEGDTFFIENGRLKAGVRLTWGGGINYIEDRQCPVEGLKNLVNQYDTGRLIQQSYYGTGECPENPDFKYGTFMGHDWCYNPVQGGDRGNCRSRLIDIEIGDKSVWVKAQPKDWGKVNWDTPSYMENTYSIDGGLIRVDNRFVDFSCWKHNKRHQELPAFYTVSYPGRFVWYDGNDPWSNGPLEVRDELNFWGLPEYMDDCTFHIKEGNTETWCAWINANDDYGIGLYVPNVDILKAGRFMYNGTKDPDEAPTNYVAPLRSIKIVSLKPIEYSYLIATGSLKDIRQKFYDNRLFSTNAGLDG